MIDYIKEILRGQFEAALYMMNDCLQKCAPEYWDGKIAKYAFWHVAYHTLCFVDLYFSPDEESFKLRAIHPQGWSEYKDEFPSRRFEKTELIDYLAICRQKAAATLQSKTEKSLKRLSGFDRLPISRGELHLYNLRHLQHHTGQLSAYLRRTNEVLQDPKAVRWVSTGWR